MGFETQSIYRLSSPLCGSCNSIELGYRGDVSFKLPGQDSGELLSGCVSVIHDGRCSIRIDVDWDDVPRRHPLKVHNVVRRGHDEGSQDTEAESALGVLGDPAT